MPFPAGGAGQPPLVRPGRGSHHRYGLLLLGTDLTHLDRGDLALLENRAVIAVDQDGVAARRVIDEGPEQVFVKRDSGGAWYAGAFNTSTSRARRFVVPLRRLRIDGAVRVSDLWSGRSLGVVRGSYTVTVAPGGVGLISAGGARGRRSLISAGGA